MYLFFLEKSSNLVKRVDRTVLRNAHESRHCSQIGSIAKNKSYELWDNYRITGKEFFEHQIIWQHHSATATTRSGGPNADPADLGSWTFNSQSNVTVDYHWGKERGLTVPGKGDVEGGRRVLRGGSSGEREGVSSPAEKEGEGGGEVSWVNCLS